MKLLATNNKCKRWKLDDEATSHQQQVQEMEGWRRSRGEVLPSQGRDACMRSIKCTLIVLNISVLLPAASKSALRCLQTECNCSIVFTLTQDLQLPNPLFIEGSKEGQPSSIRRNCIFLKGVLQ
ncbi:hypothetical protein RDI58_015521 [Solanum bulbocastanum]|uniref:Uncharacterized protein n=1 Tax=Solanum bulbocastanum TaxID=147425 RepID=A0AAN8TNH1_SOLBU